MSKMNSGRRKIITALILVGLVSILSCTKKPKISNFSPKEGRMDDEVTIAGENFAETLDGNIVKFNNVEATVVSATKDQIITKVPSAAETGRISVTTDAGTAYSDLYFKVLSQTTWTVMIYLDADNNLESAGIDDFLEMSSVGSTGDVKIVVQMDRHPYYTDDYGDWAGTKRFLIHKDDTPEGFAVEDLGEQNMGDPAVLQNFVEWAMTNYPAEHYALSIWDHGDGWRLLRQGLSENVGLRRSEGGAEWAVTKAVSSDDTDGDILYMKEVQNALEAAISNVEDHSGAPVKLDVLGYDACLMGMTEVAYAMRNVADYVVGSEDLEPGDGWPYDTVLAELVSSPATTPKQLSTLIVTQYYDSYSGWDSITQSAVDVAQIDAVCTAIDAFVDVAQTDWGDLKTARRQTVDYHFGGSSVWGMDLRHFAENVSQYVSSPDIKTAADRLKDTVDSFVIAERHSPDLEGTGGIAIYFPVDRNAFDIDPEHTGYMESNTYWPVDFVRDFSWDNWLLQYYANIP